MTRVSVKSVRVTNPLARVTVACDAGTVQALKHNRDPLLEEVDEVVTSDVFEGQAAAYRNRAIKTQLRQLLNGPFLFLDSDTFVRGDLSSRFSIDADIAAAPNHSSDEIEKQLWEEDAKTLAKMKWQIGGTAYVNGGVLFFNDTPGAYRLSALWHRKWQESVRVCGSHRDQPALNAALREERPRLAILPHEYNAQFRVAPHVAENAVVWHYYASGRFAPPTHLDDLVERTLQGHALSQKVVAEIIERPSPWSGKTRANEALAKLFPLYGRVRRTLGALLLR